MSKNNKYKQSNNQGKSHKTGGFKKFCIALAVILGIASLGIDAWALYIHLWGTTKYVSKTYELGLQTLADGTQNHTFEVNYFSNKNKNGVEMFELKVNGVLDENRTQTFSQEFQFISQSKIGFDKTFIGEGRNTNGWWIFNTQIDYLDYYAYQATPATAVYEYQMLNNEPSTASPATNKFSKNTTFKVSFADDDSQIYMVKFKSNSDINQYKPLSKSNRDFVICKTSQSEYLTYEPMYLATLLYDSVQQMSAGTKSVKLVQFEEMFEFFHYNPQAGQYNSEATKTTDKLLADFQAYATVKVNVSADGARRASDSMFGYVCGNGSYNTTGDYSEFEYYFGRTVINATEKDCALIETDTQGHYYLGLTEEFINAYLPYKNSIVLEITINTDYFNNLGVTIDGFVLAENTFALKTCNVEVI